MGLALTLCQGCVAVLQDPTTDSAFSKVIVRRFEGTPEVAASQADGEKIAQAIVTCLRRDYPDLFSEVAALAAMPAIIDVSTEAAATDPSPILLVQGRIRAYDGGSKLSDSC